MLSVLGIKNETSTLNQLGTEGAIRFLGSVKGILPNGPNGAPAFNSLESSLNPFADPNTRRGMVSYNYTLIQQGLETSVSCIYDTSSPIRFAAIDGVSITSRLISSSGSCDPAAGLEDVLEGIVDFPTLNTNNTLTYWACKQRPEPGTVDPTYFIYLRGRVNYATSIGNITCRVSPMRARDFEVEFQSVPGYFTARANLSRVPQRSTFTPFANMTIIALGNLVREAQNWEANLVAESVFSVGTKDLGVLSFNPSDEYRRLFEAMIQGVLEYEVRITLS